MKEHKLITIIKVLSMVLVVMVVIITLFTFSLLNPNYFPNPGISNKPDIVKALPIYWKAPSYESIPQSTEGELIRYGHDLIANTAEFFGPDGSIAAISNGMNCQNCHLEAGTKVYGNNFAVVASTYPKIRARSGTMETIEKRVQDCFKRSLNGEEISEDSREMQAIVAYINWLGKDVKKGETPPGSGVYQLAYLNRPANPETGKALFIQQCQVCHGADGEGQKPDGAKSYVYPPLWGEHSYNDGAGLFRISRFAGYIKTGMPLGASHEYPMLSDEQAWDIAAFVNSMPRPKMDISKDWPDISLKPVDHPFGPFSDSFPETQHKYGPFQPIVNAHKK
jgi:thiosulfate dehydrogenase